MRRRFGAELFSARPDPTIGPIAAAMRAGAAYFALVFAAGFVFGTLRVLALVPVFGELGAVLLELPAILLVAWMGSRWLVRRHRVPGRLLPRLIMGGLAFALLILGELALWTMAFARPAAEFLGHYQETPALLGLLGQLMFGLSPAVQIVSGR